MGGDSGDTHIEVKEPEPNSDPPTDAPSSLAEQCDEPSVPSSSLTSPILPAAEVSSTQSAASDASGDAMALSPEPDSPDTSAASSTFSNLRLSPQRPQRTPRSPARTTTPTKHKKRKQKPQHQPPTTATAAIAAVASPPQAVVDDSLALVDPIYLLPSPTSPPTNPAPPTPSQRSRPRVAWDRVVVYRFPLTADAGKVPGDSRSFYSVGLDYGAGEGREEWRMEEWETRRGKERSTKGCPELSAEERMEVWQQAQQQLQAEAEPDAFHTDDSATVASHTVTDDLLDSPGTVHTHNLRKRYVPPSPIVSASSSPARSPPATPLLFTDVSDLTSLRVSRARVGCSCTVPAGDRQTKVCSAPWLQQSKRGSNRRATDADDTATPAVDGVADEQADLDYMAGHDASDVACECLRMGVGCNSNTCACFSYCCRNPHERYLFNAGRVNTKRRKMLASMKEMREKGRLAAADGEPLSAGKAKAKGNGGKNGRRHHGRKRAQSV